jgi:hypothetical protein
MKVSLLGHGRGEHREVFGWATEGVVKLVFGMHPDGGKAGHDGMDRLKSGDFELMLRTV